MQNTTTNDEKLVTVGSRNVPTKTKVKFKKLLLEEKVGQQSIFLLWIIELFVARPKQFVQMCRDLEKEIEEEKLNLTQ